MNKKTITLLLVVISANIFAQDSTNSASKKAHFKPKNFMELSAGVAVPLGNYSKTDYTNPKSGYAGVGANVAFLDMHYIKKSNWGIILGVSYSCYMPKGAGSIENGYKQTLSATPTSKLRLGKYQSIQLTLGPAYSYSFGIATLDFYAMGGFNNMLSPSVSGNFEDLSGVPFSVKRDIKYTMAAEIQFGAGVRFEPVKHFGISARVNYTYVQPVFEYNDNVLGFHQEQYSQVLHALCANVGFSYIF